MAHPRYVGLRLSTQAGAVPTAADMSEGELAINVADGRAYTLAGSAVIDLTDRYTVSEIDTLLNGKADVSSLADVATSGAYSDLSGLPALGTAAPMDVAESGNAATGEVVTGDDTRLSDARQPTSHTHPWSEVTSKPDTATRWPTLAEVTDKPATYPPSAHSHTLAGITDAGTAAAKDVSAFDASGSAQAAQDHAVQRSNHTGTQPLATISDAGTAAAADTADFDPAGSAAQVEHDIRDTLRQRPDPLLMHFL